MKERPILFSAPMVFEKVIKAAERKSSKSIDTPEFNYPFAYGFAVSLFQSICEKLDKPSLRKIEEFLQFYMDTNEKNEVIDPDSDVTQTNQGEPHE
jgi:hypothetical protein